MTIDTKDLLNSILTSLARIDYVKPEDLPNIDLYMDQVTTFMDQQLSTSKRYEEDKILTKTMINNYAKNNLLPPPLKKKYSKEHVLLLIFIYYFKSILSISDIQEILGPITEKYFGSQDDFNLEEIYNEVFRLEKAEVSYLQKDIAKKFQISQTTFDMLEGKDQQEMQMFALICMLSFDVYIKKQLIEKFIDARKAAGKIEKATGGKGRTEKAGTKAQKGASRRGEKSAESGK